MRPVPGFRGSEVPGFIVGVLLLAGAVLSAHHDFAAEFDQNRPLSLRGTVSKLDWVNPHVSIYVNVPDRFGKPITWTLESGSPLVLSRSGWTREKYKKGDKVAIGGFIAKAGKNHGSAQLIRPLVSTAPVLPPNAALRVAVDQQQQAMTVLTESPWAHRSAVPVLVGPAAWAAARRGPYTGDKPADPPAGARVVTVRWQSAAPVQEALRTMSQLEDTSVLASTHRPLQPDPSHYWIAVTGFSAMMEPDGPMPFEKYLSAHAPLLLKGDRPLLPSAVYVEPFGISYDILLQYPRTRELTPSEDVELDLQLTQGTAKQIFRLKDMSSGGRLGL